MTQKMILPRFNYTGMVITSRDGDDIQFIRNNVENLPANTPIIPNPTPTDVRGKLCLGTLPLHLAMYASGIISVERDRAGIRFLQRFVVIGWEE